MAYGSSKGGGSAPNDGKGMGGPKAETPADTVEGGPKVSGVPNEFKEHSFGPSKDDGPNPGTAPRA